MSNLENIKLSNTGKMIVAAAAVTAGALVQINQNDQMVNADDTKAAVQNLGQSTNTYKIQSGDTLTKIAKANDVSLDDLVKFNGISDKNMIIVGETLQLSANNTDAKTSEANTTSDAYTAVDGTKITDLQYNVNADSDNDNFMTVSEYNAWVNGGRHEAEAASEATTEDAKPTETAVSSEATTDTAATSDADAAVDGTKVADLQYNVNADSDNDGFMTVSEYNAWVNGGRHEAEAASEATTEDAKSTETTASSEATTDTAATSDANAAVDGTKVADLQYNVNADSDNDGFMTVSEYNAWVNGGRHEAEAASEATTDNAKSTETAASSATADTAATSDANTAVDGTKVADLQYNANADSDNDGFMNVSEYNAWVNGGRHEAEAAPKAATTDNTKSTEAAAPAATETATPAKETATTNNSQNQGSWYDVAMSLTGIPYVWGGHTPATGLDCSGFTAWVYNHSGMTSNFPAYTVAQESATTSISVSAAQPGDLLFWGTPGATYHVGIYLGNNQFIAAPQPGDVVRVQTLTASWMPSFAGTLR
ncbi:NlpC/P60 family protein [Weissella koreensis]|uniref:DUF1175 family protein n=1 Tax=Weissella koreensis TaxID=165096 RepID=A0A7H1MMF4_9LACO|nr:NlpC/P60 family protein [Weissella koreensis]QGN20661.1 DUF1175 family protein [Weissella koreensis]QNT64640.1 DUF1175 family protein [Weissella koreensis]